MAPAPTTYPPQQISANSYPAQPSYPATNAPAPRSAAQPAPAPSDYGQSVMTDIRQVNF